jgi:hypothetical protein
LGDAHIQITEYKKVSGERRGIHHSSRHLMLVDLAEGSHRAKAEEREVG